MYDVIVIGAGPAGCTAAKTLSEKGYKTLLAEKFELPRNKSCSGILIEKTMKLVKLYFGENPPSFATCTPTQNRGMIFTNDKGKEFRFEQEGLNIRRSSFDCWLSAKAEESGAEIRDNTAVISCEEDENCVSVALRGKITYTEKAKYVIDCEGVIGTVKRKILKTSPQYITTFQTFNDGYIDLEPHYFYAYLQPELSEYDAWFNVKDNQLILGVAVKKPTEIKRYYQRFTDYMRENHRLVIKNEIKSEKWLMPHIRPQCNIDYGIGRILFAGEIAGFLNPMGEGISAGMESGYCAACAVSANFNNLNRIYAEYRQRTEALREYMKRQWSFTAEMAETFSEMKL